MHLMAHWQMFQQCILLLICLAPMPQASRHIISFQQVLTDAGPPMIQAEQ